MTRYPKQQSFTAQPMRIRRNSLTPRPKTPRGLTVSDIVRQPRQISAYNLMRPSDGDMIGGKKFLRSPSGYRKAISRPLRNLTR